MMPLPSPAFGANSNALALNNAFNNSGNSLAFNNTNNNLAFNNTSNNLALSNAFNTTNNLNTAINYSPVNNNLAVSNTLAPVNNTYAPVNNTAVSINNTYVLAQPVPQMQPALGQDMFAPQFGGVPANNGFFNPQMEMQQNQMIGGLMNAVQNLTSMVGALLSERLGMGRGGNCQSPCGGGNVGPVGPCGGPGMIGDGGIVGGPFNEPGLRGGRPVRYIDEEGRERTGLSLGGGLLGAGLGFALGGPVGLVLGGLGGAILGKPLGRLAGKVIEGTGKVIGGVVKGAGEVIKGVGKGIGKVAKGIGKAIKKIF